MFWAYLGDPSVERYLIKEQNQVPEPGDLEVLPARVTDFGPRKGILRMKCETESQNFYSGKSLRPKLLPLLTVFALVSVIRGKTRPGQEDSTF